MDRINGKDRFEYVPRILFQLFVTQAQSSVVLVDFKNYNIDLSTDLSEFCRMFYFLRPRQVRDVDQSVNSFFDLYEYTEVREVTHDSFMFRTNSIFLLDILPRVVFQLFDTQRHLSFVAIQGKNNSLYLVSHFHEVLSRT